MFVVISLVGFLAVLLGTAVFALLLICIVRTVISSGGPDWERFRSGTTPDPLPDGLWKGSTDRVVQGSWIGKRFIRASHGGINRFTTPHGDEERYPFATSIEPALRDPGKHVLRLNYGIAGNPWWLHLIVDEVVSVPGGELFGKVHIVLSSSVIFTMGYFSLKHAE